MEFNYQINKQKGANVIALQGELIDKNQADVLLKSVQELIDNKELKIVLDLSELKYINSSGLNVFINILTRSRKTGGDIAIARVTKKVKELLVITKLNKVFNVSETIDEAISKLENK